MTKKYAVMIDLDGEYVMVPPGNSWKTGDSPQLFNSRLAATASANLWNTGTVVEVEAEDFYDTSPSETHHDI